MFKWFKKLGKEQKTPQEKMQYDPELYTFCEECQGLGIDDPGGACFNCKGKGVIEKTRKEIWDSKINSQ